MESITKEQIRIDELGYEDEDGNEVMGEEVIADVIEQGSAAVQERRSSGIQSDVPDEEIITTVYQEENGVVKKNGINSVAKTTVEASSSIPSISSKSRSASSI